MNKAILHLIIFLVIITAFPFVLPHLLKCKRKEGFHGDVAYFRRTEWPGPFMLGLFPYRYNWLYDYYYDPANYIDYGYF